MAAYYNEHDPYAAAWLRNLIAAGHIAPGDVDERSIEDVLPIELAGYTQCHFFAGIGVWSYALRKAGWPDDRPVWTGSCPCQPFSAAGKGGGFADERHLWPTWFHLIGVCKPAIVLGEQVASKDGLAWFDLVHADMEAAGYAIGGADLCAAGVGAPHIRQRLWFVGKRLDDAAGARFDGTFGGAEGDSRDEARLRLLGEGSGNSGMADANGEDQRRRGVFGPGESDSASDGAARERSAGLRAIDGMEHAALDGRQQWRAEPGERSLERGRGVERMGDTDDTRLEGRGGSAGSSGELAVGLGSVGGRLANSGGERREGEPVRLQPGQQGQAVPEAAGRGADGRLADANGRNTGPTNGHWRAADWLFCRDGKWRPVEPGTFPLADGVANRVGRLRAYGNAIVAEAAQAFIESVM